MLDLCSGVLARPWSVQAKIFILDYRFSDFNNHRKIKRGFG
jgi:hypothetical protein